MMPQNREMRTIGEDLHTSTIQTAQMGHDMLRPALSRKRVRVLDAEGNFSKDFRRRALDRLLKKQRITAV